ncbi:MAG: hypothetical protein RL310_819, partial [Actinomycetota bacterium]
ITGASGGIGLALTEIALNDGHEVVAISRKPGGLAQLQQNYPALTACTCDLAEFDQIKAAVSFIKSHFSCVDILINNAGVMSDASIIQMSDALWDEAININLTAAFKLIRACAPSMVSKKWGRVINISSQVALTGSANHAHYATAKAGLLGLTYSAAKEYGASGVTVNAVLPGRIETKMIADRSIGRLDEWLSQTPLNRLGRPEEVASMINFLASEQASYVTGAAINVNGGLVMG